VYALVNVKTPESRRLIPQLHACSPAERQTVKLLVHAQETH